LYTYRVTCGCIFVGRRPRRHAFPDPSSLQPSTVPIFRLVTTLAFCAFLVCIVAPGPSQAQTTFTVNTNIDVGGGSPDGTCDALPSTSGDQCTLREAIVEANDAANGSAGPDVIEFDTPNSSTSSNPFFIGVSSPLPEITEPVEIDGTSASSFSTLPVIQIDGGNAGTGANGLRVAFDLNGGGELILRSISITNFDGTAIVLDDGANRILDAHLGVEPDGVTAGGNFRGGFVGAGAQGTTFDNNIISGNTARGLSVTDDARITNNRIGVDKDDNALGNGEAGVSINADDVLVQGNVIAYNGGDGVEVSSLTPPDVQNQITGNALRLNGGVGIDLEGGTEDSDGRTANDAGDADDGANRLQNYPVIEATSVDPATGDVTITYYVDSDPSLSTSGASAYPLQINFYQADADQEEGFGILTQETYTSSDYSGCGAPPCPKTTTFQSLVSVTESDYVTATATDADGNTSELSAPSSQLPVELANFSAQANAGRSVTLTWTTLSETNNAGFSIERRVEGGPFEEAGYQSGAGTTTAFSTYRFTDDGLPAGARTATYRLRQVDVDGNARVVGRVGVRLTSGSSFSLARPTPNPVADVATVDVSVPADMDDASLVLFDLLGRRVRSLDANVPRGSSAVNIRVDDLAAGTYLLRLTGNGRVQTQKLTVVR